MRWNVTVTGPDDGVDPMELVKLSDEFPNVEWGILLSRTMKGRPRYPSWAWRAKLRDVAASHPNLRLAAHLCDDFAVDVGRGERIGVADGYLRVQINGFSLMMNPPSDVPYTYVLPVASEASLQQAAHYIERKRLPASLLFDPSSGTGQRPFRWARGPLGVSMGYAGGIDPDNVQEILGEIVAVCTGPIHETWIDLCSGVRDENDAFDLKRVRRLLEAIP